MSSVLRAAVLGAVLCAALPAGADSIHLRDGRVLTGEFLGATARTLHLRVAERIRRVPIAEVARMDLDPRSEAEPVGAASPSRRDERVTIVGTGPAQAIEREPVAR